MKAFLIRRGFLLSLASVLFIGMMWPQPLEPVAQQVRQRQGAMVATVLFLMALPLDAGAMWQAMRRPGAVLLAVAINFGILPLVAWGVSHGLPTELGIGLLIAAAVPCTLVAATAWTRRAGGNDTVALLVTMVTSLGCFLVTPLWLALTTAQQVDLDPFAMMQRLALLVVLPTIAAQLLRLHAPLANWATAKKRPLGGVAQCGILSMIFVGAVRSGLQLASSTQDGIRWYHWLATLVAVMGVHLSMLWLGHLLARMLGMPRKDRIAVGFSGSQKTFMVGLDVATRYYSPLAMLPMVAYHVGQLLVDTMIADRLRQAEPSPDEP